MRVRSFASEQPGPPDRRTRAEKFEQEQREKEGAPLEDEKDQVSFEGSFMGLKVLAFSIGVFGSMYFLHVKMTEKVEQRNRIRKGLEDPDSTKDQRIAIGGPWVLKDLDGNDFGSHTLYGKYYLLYFGFSLCPDVCPLNLLKMTKAVRKLRQSREAKQFFDLRPVFVTSNPEYDTPQKLIEYAEEESNQSPRLLDMLRKFKVPIGLNEEERQVVIDFFSQTIVYFLFLWSAFFLSQKEQERKQKWFSWLRWRQRGIDQNEGMLNDHSRVFYLMSPDNRFIAFYRLDLDENELRLQILEDISTDIGQKYIGTGQKPLRE